MDQSCRMCSASFQVYPDEYSFLEKMRFRYGDVEVALPKPILCPECRQQLRVLNRNERHFYHRQSDLSGKQIISLYPPEAPWGKSYKVFSPEEWYSDKWDPLAYGRDFDFSRPFFEQLSELHKDVPRLALVAVGNENSPYTTGTGYCKNCHMINSSEYCEDCLYGKLLQNCKDCLDCTYCYDSELCCQCFSIYKCYGCIYVSYSVNCNNCWFSENLTACSDCLFCTNLNQKQYCLLNEELGKEAYQRKLKEIQGSRKAFKEAEKRLEELRGSRIHKFAQIVKSEDCSGDFIQNSKNCVDCYDVNESRDCRYVTVGVNVRDTYDCSNMYINCELNYQVLGTIEVYHCAYTLYVFHSQDVLYSEMIYHSQNIFGCVGLTRKQYCIFNKEYSKEEYDKLVPKIIDHMKSTGEWGMFFPPKYAPHAYNESLAQEYSPLTEAEVLALGWNWRRDTQKKRPEGKEMAIPDNIKDVDESICSEILICKETGRPYKILPQEFRFYQKMEMPIPIKCPDLRYDERMRLRNQRNLFPRKCDSCEKDILSTFSLAQSETIYCEKCYTKHVFS